MADVDLLNQFPNSKMAGAVKLGQSRFISVDDPATTLQETVAAQAQQEDQPPPPAE